ncbi:E3 ubiquitin-protein ligase rnf146-like [Argiope bruennichi]|uniref:E3 ubiquitin-protein ligase rnf146-like n=1 Tax=Argiope bruennichi TaxID=94029 RepID=UPI00249485F0|nr:E3 ubiquitin-protein ligase rnf146-like [Argiope bruennichi]XP_055953714.1 E3 ubiquitin-protein ligase rnf146-like [Argiope bruennichi]
MEADSTTEDNDLASKLECAVCLQPCVQPVQLPCRHVFCYLCVKGVTHQSKRCAMCRQEIPANYLDNPNLIAASESCIAFEGYYQWFYEGRNGWWQYDDRTSSEIEAAFKKGEPQCEVLIAGFLYIIDFQKNLQVRRCDPYRKRRIKRDLITIPKKGVAGIRHVPGNSTSDVNRDGDNNGTADNLSNDDISQNDPEVDDSSNDSES